MQATKRSNTCHFNPSRAAFEEQAAFITPYVERRRIGASNIGRFPVRINKSRDASSPSQLEMWQKSSQRITTINGLRSNRRLHKRGIGVGLMASYNMIS